MFRSILLPLDGSAFAEHAIPYALEIARLSGAVLHPARVYVLDEPWRSLEAVTPYPFEFESAYEAGHERKERSDKRGYLDRVAELARERRISERSELLDGPVADALVRHARRVRADLVVMTTHGHGPLKRAWIGSVADQLVRRMTVPILLVRPHEGESPDLGQAPVFGRMLIPLDGSALAEQVLGSATALGRLWEANCMLLTVVAPSDHLKRSDRSLAATHGESRQYVAARTYLDRIARKLRAPWSHVDVRVVEETHAARAILEQANSLGTDLLAVSTHGRGGLARLFLGSVADKLVRGATVPLLVHRPKN